MEDSFRPLFVAPSTFEDGQVTFHTCKKEISTHAPIEIINELVAFCDGNRTVADVIEHTKDDWSQQSVTALIETLHGHGVVVDGRYLGNHFWKTIKNPSPIHTYLEDERVAKLVREAAKRHRLDNSKKEYSISETKLQQALQGRESIRSFSGEAISHQNLVDILWSAYGEVSSNDSVHRRTVPSAGGLFPLQIGLVLFQSTEELEAGVYKVRLPEPQKVSFSLVSKDVTAARRGFAKPMTVARAAGAIIVNGTFDIGGEKYGNRSTPYAILEAGHVAQNVHLAASQAQISTVEIGGFYEKLLGDLQHLSGNHKPLTTVVFGIEGETPEPALKQGDFELMWPATFTDEYQLPFSMALARMKGSSNERSWSSGKAMSPELARTKALSEAREWNACGNMPETFVHESFSNLNLAINPQDVVSFHPKQYGQDDFPLDRFDPDQKHGWVKGTDELAGVDIYVPVDTTYYPNALPENLPRFMSASTSGVAAHPNWKQALKYGVLELIERDAFMVTYLAQLTQPTVEIDTLPEFLQERIVSLKECGFSVWIKDISIGLAPVVFLYAQNHEHGATICSSCARFDLVNAIDHALMELEQSVLGVLKGYSDTKVHVRDVKSPSNHGKLYTQADHFQRSDFLVQGGDHIPLKKAGKRSVSNWKQLLSEFEKRSWRLVTVPLHVKNSLGGNAELHIIRSIIPNLVPMMFGHGKLPCGMERIYKVAEEYGKKITYESMPTFPHPFA